MFAAASLGERRLANGTMVSGQEGATLERERQRVNYCGRHRDDIYEKQ